MSPHRACLGGFGPLHYLSLDSPNVVQKPESTEASSVGFRSLHCEIPDVARLNRSSHGFTRIEHGLGQRVLSDFKDHDLVIDGAEPELEDAHFCFNPCSIRVNPWLKTLLPIRNSRASHIAEVCDSTGLQIPFPWPNYGFDNCQSSPKKSAATTLPGVRAFGAVSRSITAQSGSFGTWRALLR